MALLDFLHVEADRGYGAMLLVSGDLRLLPVSDLG